MFLQNSDGSVEIHVCVFSNKYVFGNLLGDSRKKKETPSTPKKQKKKDPEENLGNVIATLDTKKIEIGVDFIAVNEAIESIVKKSNITYKELFSNQEIVTSLCKSFELTLKELVSMMLEHRPDIFSVGFIRSVIRPFIAKIKTDKYNYDNETELCTGYRPIFDLL